MNRDIMNEGIDRWTEADTEIMALILKISLHHNLQIN